MAYRSVRVSDLSGVEGDDNDFITLIVRHHPSLDEPVQLDVLPDEVKGLKTATNLVVLEVRHNGDEPVQLVTTVADFNKLSPNMGEVLANADGLRGRRKGYRPGKKGG